MSLETSIDYRYCNPWNKTWNAFTRLECRILNSMCQRLIENKPQKVGQKSDLFFQFSSGNALSAIVNLNAPILMLKILQYSAPIPYAHFRLILIQDNLDCTWPFEGKHL